MKHLFLVFLVTSFFTGLAYAEGQTETDCPMMAQSNQRTNTKENLKNSSSKKVKSKSAGVSDI